MTPQEQALVSSFLEQVIPYLQENPLADNALVDYRDYANLEATFDTAITPEGVNEEALLASMHAYLNHCVRTRHPQFWGKLYSSYNIPALVGEMLSNLTNTSMATYVGSPVATLIENKMVEKMGQRVGFENGDGIFVSGGTQANLVAVLSARNRIDETIKRAGIRHQPQLALFVSDQAHYSFLSAANILGIGIDNVVRVKSNALGQMDVDALEARIQEAIEQDKRPFFVAATAGTTVLGAFDPIAQIAQVADQYGLWFHIDGAFGGSALLSQRHRSLLAGCELAHSFTWDAHKMMGAPLPCSVILMREKGWMYDACTTGDVTSASRYIFHDLDETSFDLGQKSIQCTRKVDALKLWFAWKYYGDDSYEQRFDHALDTATYAAQQIEASPYLALTFPRQFVNLCFHYTPAGDHDLDVFTKSLQQQLIQKGLVYINYTQVKGRPTLRVNVINPEVGRDEIDYLLNAVVEAGQAQEQNLSLVSANGDV